MKKVSILVIFTISLFFFSFSSVSAATTYNYTFTEDDFSYINDDFINIRTKTLNYINNSEDYDYYVISYDLQNSRYIVNILETKELSSDREFGSSGQYYYFNVRSSVKRFVLENDNFVEIGPSSNLYSYVISDGVITYYNFLDYNFDIYPKSLFCYFIDLNLNYNDMNYTILQEEKVPSLYDLYIEWKVGEKYDLHEEEKNVLLNYYNLVIEKIGFLVNMFTGNYIYLSMFVIVLILVIIELVRRLL